MIQLTTFCFCFENQKKHNHDDSVDDDGATFIKWIEIFFEVELLFLKNNDYEIK